MFGSGVLVVGFFKSFFGGFDVVVGFRWVVGVFSGYGVFVEGVFLGFV